MPPPTSSRAPARPTAPTAEERAADEAVASTVVLWRGEPIAFDRVPRRIAELSGREERERLLAGYREALDALDPLLARRLAAWLASGDPVQRAAALGPDPRQLVVDLERFVLHSETPYFAALRRNLALIGIEQGDATVADLWHVLRGAAFDHWFGERAVADAVTGPGLSSDAAPPHLAGWQAAEARLAGSDADGGGANAADGRAVVAAARRTLVGSPEWLAGDLGMAAAEVPAFADFAAFARLWRLRRDVALLHYELRLFAEGSEPELARAYYAGIVGNLTGVIVPEEAYLVDVASPFASVGRLVVELAAAAAVEVLEREHGSAWWREAEAASRLDGIGAAPSATDVLAQLGYDGPDWRPVLRQIRTRLIGEMSGYGGPNITTRAGTRKV